jgi:hypothetical protein
MIYWGAAVMTAVHLLNRSPTRPLMARHYRGLAQMQAEGQPPPRLWLLDIC